MGRFENDDPFMPWNEPCKDDPSQPWNNPSYRDDPFAPWNDRMADRRDAEEYYRRNRIDKDVDF